MLPSTTARRGEHHQTIYLDCYVIIWKLNEENIDGLSQLANMDGGNVEDKESWQVVKMLRYNMSF